MKKMKKMIALVLSAIMVLAMGMTAMAAQDPDNANKITITIDPSGSADENATNETYTAYKIFDVTKTSDVEDPVNTNDTINLPSSATGFAYTIKGTDAWYSAVSTYLTDYFVLTPAAGASEYFVTLKSDKEANAATAIAIAEILKAHIPAGAPTVNITPGTPATVDAGYYMITSSLGTKLVLATSSMSITEKNTYPSLTKTADKANMNVGDKVTYTIKVTLPDSVNPDATVTIHDTLDTALKDSADYAAKIDGTETPVALTTETTAPGDTFTLSFNTGTGVNFLGGKTVAITYTAELLSTAAANTEYTNKAYLNYSNFQTTQSTAAVKTFDFNLKKTDGTNVMDGAEFELRTVANDAGTAIKFITDGTGYVRKDSDDTGASATIAVGSKNIRGLEAGTYYLVETKAPSGYNKLNNAIEVTIADDGAVTIAAGTLFSISGKDITVVNKKGLELPSTGGIGTTIFYVVGTILLLGAAILLVVRRRMRTEV